LKDPYLMILKYRNILLNDLVILTNLNEEVLLNKLSLIKDFIEIRNREIRVLKPLDLSIFLIKNGYSIREISKYIDWYDFEKVVGEVLSLNSYFVYRNLRVTRPVRMEIDIIGVDIASGRGLLIDCKHWSRGVSRSSLVKIIDKHRERVLKFIKYFNWFRNKWIYFKYIKSVIPLIITLTTPIIRVYNNVLVVSIQELNNVLIDLYNVLDIFNIQEFSLRKFHTGY